MTATNTAGRISSIDTVRGLVMVIMALDHVRDLLHTPALTQNPTDLSTTTPAIFLTRWITHLCAPTFVFLSGTSAYLSLRKRNTAAGRWFLARRGLVLLVLELTVVNFAFWFDIHFQTIMLQVIYAIGGGLLLLSVLARLPVRWLAGLGLLIIFGHNLLQLVPVFTSLPARLGWSLLFRPDLFTMSLTFTLLVVYPLVPWFGVMLVGYACGALMERPDRKQILLRIGMASLALFLVLRGINLYGDPVPWAAQKSPVFTLLSFVNVTKYPPSLHYDLLMLGLMLVLLALTDGVSNGLTRWLTVYGTVPMFYYILHWYLVHLSMVGMSLLQGFSLADLPIGPLDFGRPAGAGISLAGVYGVWAGLVLLLYLPCRWYGRYRASHPEIGWLRYL